MTFIRGPFISIGKRGGSAGPSYWANSGLFLFFGEVSKITGGRLNNQVTGASGLQCIPIAFAAATSFTVTGKRNDATALTDLLSKLAAKGIIIDSTTAS